MCDRRCSGTVKPLFSCVRASCSSWLRVSTSSLTSVIRSSSTSTVTRMVWLAATGSPGGDVRRGLGRWRRRRLRRGGAGGGARRAVPAAAPARASAPVGAAAAAGLAAPRRPRPHSAPRSARHRRPPARLPVAARPATIALIRSSAVSTRLTMSGVAVSTPSRTLPSTFSAACATCSSRGRPRKPQVPLIVCTRRKISDSVSPVVRRALQLHQRDVQSAMLSLVSVRKSASRSSMAALVRPGESRGGAASWSEAHEQIGKLPGRLSVRRSDSSSGGSELGRRPPAPAGISIDSRKPWPGRSSAVSGPCRRRAIGQQRLPGRGLVIAARSPKPGRPGGARTGDRHQNAVRGRAGQRHDAAAGQALGGQQQQVQDDAGRRRREYRAGSSPARSSRTRRLLDRPSAKPRSRATSRSLAVLAPGGAQQLQPLDQLDRRVLGERQCLAVRLLLAGDLQHADQRAQRPAQIMAEASAEQFCQAQRCRSCRSIGSLSPRETASRIADAINRRIYGPAATGESRLVARHLNPRPGWRKSQDGREEPRHTDDRSVRPGHHLSARFGHRPLRPSLRLLHGGGHDVPAEAGPADAGGAGPDLRRLHPAGHQQDPHHRRRAAGAARRDDAVPAAWARGWATAG